MKDPTDAPESRDTLSDEPRAGSPAEEVSDGTPPARKAYNGAANVRHLSVIHGAEPAARRRARGRALKHSQVSHRHLYGARPRRRLSARRGVPMSPELIALLVMLSVTVLFVMLHLLSG